MRRVNFPQTPDNAFFDNNLIENTVLGRWTAGLIDHQFVVSKLNVVG